MIAGLVAVLAVGLVTLVVTTCAPPCRDCGAKWPLGGVGRGRAGWRCHNRWGCERRQEKER
jgi:hypothetical protein